MQVLRLLAPRRGMGVATTITAAPEPANDSSERPPVDPPPEDEEYDDDDGPFFDLDFSATSVRASSSSSDDSDDSTDDDLTDLDFVISLHRSRSASPSFHHFPAPPLLKPAAATAGLRTLSFARATASNGNDAVEEPERRRAAPPPRDVIRRYLTKLSTRLRSVSVSVRPRPRRRGERVGGGGFRRLRKSRSASAAVANTTTTACRDDSAAEKQDGIASAIAHCKESLSLHRRASMSMSDSPLPRSRSDPGYYVQSS